MVWEIGEAARRILRHHRTCALMVVEPDPDGGIAGAYRALTRTEALRALLDGRTGEPEDAEEVRDDPEAWGEPPEDRYGEELDHLAAYPNRRWGRMDGCCAAPYEEGRRSSWGRRHRGHPTSWRPPASTSSRTCWSAA